MEPTANLFLALVLGSIGALYALRLRPTTHRQWVYVAVTIAFLAWMLPLMATLR